MKRLSDDPVVRLAECRGVTLNAEQTQQKMRTPAFDEAAERDKAYVAWDGFGDWASFRDGWFACAKFRAGVVV